MLGSPIAVFLMIRNQRNPCLQISNLMGVLESSTSFILTTQSLIELSHCWTQGMQRSNPRLCRIVSPPKYIFPFFMTPLMNLILHYNYCRNSQGAASPLSISNQTHLEKDSRAVTENARECHWNFGVRDRCTVRGRTILSRNLLELVQGLSLWY